MENMENMENVDFFLYHIISYDMVWYCTFLRVRVGQRGRV